MTMIPPIISRPLPNAVTYDLTLKNLVTITLPSGSQWTSGLHFHQTHIEYLRVLKGSVRIRLGDENFVVTATPGSSQPLEIRVGKHAWHEWGRADPNDETEVVVVERTDPEDGEKAVFFWNLNGVILHAQRMVKPRLVPGWMFGVFMEVWVSLQLFAIFGVLDNFPVVFDVRGVSGLVPGSRRDKFLHWVEQLFARVVVGAVAMIAKVLGISAVRKEFTPEAEYGSGCFEQGGDGLDGRDHMDNKK
ncbi:Cupin, RmlC-type [Apodospora peruviana]|uniref:Cupin, RmlC-type n=1 Tax=Apodospora peruviana TaxID=516989 RepID=A0AAE0HUR6_9PEZI|nr:Cupin, RmlC-type [Apodospora peruviana]